MALGVQRVCLEGTCLILGDGNSIVGRKTAAPALRSGLSQRSFLFSFPYYLSVKGKAGGEIFLFQLSLPNKPYYPRYCQAPSCGTTESEV